MIDPRVMAWRQTSPSLGQGVFVADTARIIGDVHVGEGASVWFGSVIRGDVHHVRIGDRVNIQDLSVVHVTTGRHPTIVEDDVTIGHRVVLHGCTVRSGALVGMGAIVMDKAEIGRGAMVGAGSLVTPGTIIPPGTLAVGRPARVRRELSEEERDNLVASAAHYVDIARQYLASGYGGVQSR